MKISKITTFPVEIPLIPAEEGGLRPFVSGFHQVNSARSIIVKVETDEGITGWGEMKDQFLRPDIMKAIIENRYGEAIIGQDPFLIHRIRQQMSLTVSNQYMTGSFYACGVEMACWDIMGKALSQPVHNLIGGKIRSEIPICHVSGYLDIETTRSLVKKAKRRGYKTFKTKAGRNVGYDLERIQEIRQEAGDAMKLRIDPNQKYSLPEALRFINGAERLNLEFLEQPIRINSFSDLASLRQRSRVPIAINEDCYLEHNFFKAIRENAIDAACPEIETLGGITGLMEINSVARQANVPLAHHHAFDLGIKTAAIIQATATLSNFDLAMDSTYYAHADFILSPPLEIKDGSFVIPEGPGLGIEVDEEKLRQYGISGG